MAILGTIVKDVDDVVMENAMMDSKGRENVTVIEGGVLNTIATNVNKDTLEKVVKSVLRIVGMGYVIVVFPDLDSVFANQGGA